MNAQIEQPADEGTVERSTLPAATVETSLAVALSRAELDQQISTAKAFPRSYQRFIDQTRSLVTLNEKIAESCNYALPRKGKGGRQTYINGPSVRFAEIALGRYGNCIAASRIVGEDSGYIIAEGIFHDLETLAITRTQVRRRITDKNGQRYSVDMVGVTGNAAAQIAKRNAILQGIGKALWDTMYQDAIKAAAGTSQTIEKRRAEMIKHFASLGVTESELFAAVEVGGEADIGAEQLGTLRALARQIKDGDLTVEQAFRPELTTPPKGDTARKVADELLQQQITPAGFDGDAAETRLRGCTKLKELIAAWTEIRKQLGNAEVPLAVSAAYTEMREAIEAIEAKE